MPFWSEVFLQDSECGPDFLDLAGLKTVVEQGVDLQLIKAIAGSVFVNR